MRKALVIGINQYPRAPLKGCVNDAEEVAGLLQKHGNGNPDFDVRSMLDPQKRAEVLTGIQDLFKGDEEVALLYFSGHGYINAYGGNIVMPDCVEDDYHMGIAMKDIMTIVNKSKVKNKIVILDCCHAGNIGDTEHEDYAQLKSGVSILTACRKDEYALEMGGHGLFTELLCEGLRGGAADFNGNISIGSVYAYIDKSLDCWTQRPIFKTNVSEFVSLRNVIPKVSIDVIRKITEFFKESSELLQLDPSFEFTNSPDYKCESIRPYAVKENVEKFKLLQQLQSIGFVEPCDEKYMYFAAMNSKKCRLTSVGRYYWRLVKNGRI